MTKAELTVKVQAVMMAHLKSKGFPKMNGEQIMAELKPMWIKLEEAQLIQPGMNFKAFVARAQQAHLLAMLTGRM